MNSEPFKITIISVIITVFIIVIGSMPEVQRSIAVFTDQISSLEDAAELKPVEKNNKVAGVEEVKVNRVVDGDTVVLEDGRTIRLLNVDTPETKKPGVAVMCYGPEASSYTTKMLENRIILIKPDKEDKDRYGRSLRFIFFVGEDTSAIANSFNAKLIKEGYAKSSTVKPNNTYQNYFETLERQTKQLKVGAWGECPDPFNV